MPSRDSEASLDWGDIQFFLAVAENGGIGPAAGRLAVNHSTVLRRIARLEGRLGARLFDRLPGGYALTAGGNALAEHLTGLSQQVDSALRQLTGLDPAIEGPVRIASSDIVIEGLLMPLLARFRGRHPAVQIQLVTTGAPIALTTREADLAIRNTDKAPSNLIAQCVGDVEFVVCGARPYLARTGSETPLSEHRWVAAHESLSSQRLEGWLRRHVHPDRVVARIDSLAGVADAVASSLGLGMLPRPLVRARSELVELGTPDPSLRKPLWILMHPDVQHTARVRALFDFLCEALSEHTGLAHG